MVSEQAGEGRGGCVASSGCHLRQPASLMNTGAPLQHRAGYHGRHLCGEEQGTFLRLRLKCLTSTGACCSCRLRGSWEGMGRCNVIFVYLGSLAVRLEKANPIIK